MVEAERLEAVHRACDRRPVCRRAHGAKVVVVGHALQEHLLAIETQAELLREFDGADAEPLGQPVDHLASGRQFHLRHIQRRRLDRPQLRRSEPKLRQGHFDLGEIAHWRHRRPCFTDLLAIGRVDAGGDLDGLVFTFQTR